MSPCKDETGRGFVIVSGTVIAGRMTNFIVFNDGVQHLNFVDNDQKKYWLKQIKRA